MTVITRFAPSPTGYLHVGSARTALYCWLFARKMAGKFILRIEDTDLERSTPEAVQAILDGMNWLGLNYDAGPFYQTQHFSRYKAVAEQLLMTGKAYRCYCSKERLEELRKTQLANKQKPRYDGLCRQRTDQLDSSSYVIRFKNPQTGEVIVNDLIRGPLTFNNEELDDLIIVRSDGAPTYNFSVVVDDMDMNITHVIRGDDHINNTPRQINILQALGVLPPLYAHLAMILGSDGKKLSKRHGAVSVMQYREEGFLPQALLNYLVRLGWSHGDQEIFSIAEMIQNFDIAAIHKSAAAFNMEKLLWLNQHYIKTSDPDEIAKELQWHFYRLGIDTVNGPPVKAVLIAQLERAKTLREMAEKSRFFYADVSYNEKSISKYFTPDAKVILVFIKDELENLTNWNAAVIHEVITRATEKFQVKMGQVAQPLRVAITGDIISPPIDATVFLIGQSRVVQRINQALKVHF